MSTPARVEMYCTQGKAIEAVISMPCRSGRTTRNAWETCSVTRVPWIYNFSFYQLLGNEGE
jgi:hypothetical protein